MKKKYFVRLTDEERAICDATIKKEKGKSEKLRRAASGQVENWGRPSGGTDFLLYRSGGGFTVPEIKATLRGCIKRQRRIVRQCGNEIPAIPELSIKGVQR